jgi:hypothetical protein
VARPDLASPLALLQKLFDHTQGNPVPLGNLLAGSFQIFIGSQDTFSEVQQQRLHALTGHHKALPMATVLIKLL